MADTPTVTDATFAGVVERARGLTLVDGRAPWCPPCLLLSPVVDRVAAVYAGRVRVAKLNLDDGPRTAQRLGVRAVPTPLLFEGGHVVASHVGAVPGAQVEALLDAHLAPRGVAAMARAVWHDAVLAESEDVVVVDGYTYFPRGAVRWELLEPSEHRSTCPWKGQARYYTVRVNGATNPDAAWAIAEAGRGHGRRLPD